MARASIDELFHPERAVLAPLAGVTDSVYRRICARLGATPVMTEMVSSDGLVRGGLKGVTGRLVRYKEEERPLGIQIFGSDPAIMGEAAAVCSALGPDFIDINAGCPVKKVITRGAGSALMRTPEVLAAIVRAVADASAVPVTVKIRSGWDFDSINAVEVARRCVDAGASAVIVHPRTRSQGFSGEADWDIIRAVQEAVAVPVIGSGDIREPEDAPAMLERTGARAVMIGRAALGDPWIFLRTAHLLRGEPVPPPTPVADRLDCALAHLDMLAAETTEIFAVLNMRKFFGWYSRGARGGADFRQEVFRAEAREDVHTIVRAFQARLREQQFDSDCEEDRVQPWEITR